jgi:hypothetical protein
VRIEVFGSPTRGQLLMTLGVTLDAA